MWSELKKKAAKDVSAYFIPFIPAFKQVSTTSPFPLPTNWLADYQLHDYSWKTQTAKSVKGVIFSQ